MRYQNKPCIVEAFQMTRERRLDNSEWPVWLHKAWQKSIGTVGALFCSSDGGLDTETHTPLFLQQWIGTRKVYWGDWIVRGPDGALDVCEPEAFEALYETAKTDPNH